MNYHLEIIKHFENDTFDLFMQWSQMQEDTIQLEIMKAMQDVFTEMNIIHGKDPKEDESLQILIAKTANFEEMMKEKKKAKELTNELEAQKTIIGKRIEDHIEFTREYVIEAIVNNMHHATEMQEEADRMIEFEKKIGTFDFNNWKEIL